MTAFPKSKMTILTLTVLTPILTIIFLAQKFGRMDLFCYLCGVFIYYPTNSI